MANGNGNGNGKNLPKGMNKAQKARADLPKGMTSPQKAKADKPKSWLQNAGGKVGGAIASYARKQAGVAPADKPTKLKSRREKEAGKNGNGNGS